MRTCVASASARVTPSRRALILCSSVDEKLAAPKGATICVTIWSLLKIVFVAVVATMLDAMVSALAKDKRVLISGMVFFSREEKTAGFRELILTFPTRYGLVELSTVKKSSKAASALLSEKKSRERQA